jgi:nitrate reductase assembly molybdenum cofactor insertion protein NarJ
MTTLTPRACDRLAGALAYPGTDHASAVEECAKALEPTSPAAAELIGRFRAATEGWTVVALQELYTSTFDMEPGQTLDLSWHFFGEGYERGAFLAMLRQHLRAAGVQETAELPDHVTHVLRLIGRAPEPRAGEFVAFALAALDHVVEALKGSTNPYEILLRAVIEALRPVPVDGSEQAGSD